MAKKQILKKRKLFHRNDKSFQLKKTDLKILKTSTNIWNILDNVNIATNRKNTSSPLKEPYDMMGSNSSTIFIPTGLKSRPFYLYDKNLHSLDHDLLKQGCQFHQPFGAKLKYPGA